MGDVLDGFFQAGGTLDPKARSYIVREADEELWGLLLSGEYCNVLTARQMGKSSLIVRAQQRLEQQGVRSVLIDLTSIGSQDVAAEEWYYTLVSEIRRRLGLEIDEHSWWVERGPLSPVQRLTEFLRQVVLANVPGRVVVFVDEIDSMLARPFADDFFIAIRAMFNERANDPVYKRLSFVLVGVAHPQDLIKDRRLTPYNIGRTVDLKDFSAQNATVLRPGLDDRYPEQAQQILDRILHWTAGHPYLTQKLCFEVVKQGGETWPDGRIDNLVEQLFFREGQIRAETHLQWIDEFVWGNEDRDQMLQVYWNVLAGDVVKDEERSIVNSKLKLSGLVKASPQGYLQVRNLIYEHVFGPEWTRAIRPGGEPWKMCIPDGRIKMRSRLLGIGALFVLIALAIVGAFWGPNLFATRTLTPTETQTQIAASTSTPTGAAVFTNAAEVTLATGSTATPVPPASSTPTLTAIPIAVATSTPTRTALPTPRATNTLTPVPSPTHTLQPTSTPTAAATPYVVVTGEWTHVRTGPGLAYDSIGQAERGETFPLLASNGERTWWRIEYRDGMAWVGSGLVQAYLEGREIAVAFDIPPTPTATATLTPSPTPTPLPPPVLLEPQIGESLPYNATIRFKFIWVRRLKDYEKVSLYLRAVDKAGELDWWASEEDILGGGGAIWPVEGGYQFEVNSGMGSIPPGKVIWRVAIFEDMPPNKPQVSPWSEERLIFRELP